MTCQSFRIYLVQSCRALVCPLPGIKLQTPSSIVIRAKRQLEDLWFVQMHCLPLFPGTTFHRSTRLKSWNYLALNVIPHKVLKCRSDHGHTLKMEVSFANWLAFTLRALFHDKVVKRLKSISEEEEKISELEQTEFVNFTTSLPNIILVFQTGFYSDCIIGSLCWI